MAEFRATTQQHTHESGLLPSPVSDCRRISDYAIIGDCRSAALVHRNGSIEWLCWPRFDSTPIFAALLDPNRGGCWRIAPAAPDQFRATRSYIRESNVLQTRFESSQASFDLVDCFPVMTELAKRNVLSPDHEIVRQLHCTEGEVEIELIFHPRAEFGKRDVRFRKLDALGLQFECGRGVHYLRSSVPLHINQGCATARFVLNRGERAHFSYSYAEVSPVVLPPLGNWTEQRIQETVGWWQEWASDCRYSGPLRGEIIRSALALKLLTYAPSGAVVAAATTSLPECLGGSLNWDYRFCWLRDASLTIRTMLGLGYTREADAFMEWLLTATRLTQPELRILYTVYGENAPKEKTLNQLSGFCNSRPVRIGNQAREQIQLDVYGEVLDAAAQYAFHGGKFDRAMQKDIVAIGRYVAEHWNQPDQGIWEPREHPSNHTHSRVLCWTALDRLISLSEKGCLANVPLDDFKRERDRITRQVKQEAWNPKLNSYVSILGGDELDASLLLLSYYGFEAADSDRMQATYRAIRKHLAANDHLLYRYINGPREGAFGLCSFWEAEFLALGGGTLEQAEQLFNHLLEYRNDVGLYAEEVAPDTGDALGNVPQAFTHVGLISAALSIDERKMGATQLPHRGPDAQEVRQAA
jgi:GH15 family glucan-1,4-alpha-glucosidase